MKIFTQGLLARRKMVLLFLLAILLPSLIVGYLSLRTFSEKRRAVQNLLEANLWSSGETAIKTIEDELLEMEESILERENFSGWIQGEIPNDGFSGESAASVNTLGKPFLVDENFKIVLPRTASLDISAVEWAKDSTDSPFSRTLRTAETLEFSQKDYSRALEIYGECMSLGSSEHQKAAVLEASGRCLLALKRYDEAYKIYEELSTEYGHLLNTGGHPYGITANLQLFEAGKHLHDKKTGLNLLLDSLKNLKDGKYPVALAIYDFFLGEIEAAFDSELKNSEHPGMREIYTALKARQSPYLEILVYADYLQRNAIPEMKQRLALTVTGEEAPSGRYLAADNGSYCLVSYRTFPDFQDKRTFYGGFSWNLDSLRTEIFPDVLEKLEKNTKLHIRMIDDKGRNVLRGNEELISAEEGFSFSYRRFPLPWSISVIQPAAEDVVRATRRDNVFYGVLLGFVVVLMLFGAVLIARDISRETETTRLKTEFVHHVSHELKTPLTLIRLYGETLQRKKDLSKSEQTEAYEIITKESERLSHLINNVLDFSRIEMGKKEFDFKKGSLAGVVRDTLESYRYHLEKKGFAIQEDIARDLPEMTFDAEAIASVLINLLSNAIKFSSTVKEVSVKLFRQDPYVVLQVIDKGIGISSKEISRVFDKFYRSKDVKAADAKGSGLGLTLVKHITEEHGGQIELHSEKDRGSTFSIILPLSSPGRR